MFNGQKKIPYTITDIPDPLNRYGESKLAGEQAILNHTEHFIIIRTSWLFGLNGKSFPATIHSLINKKTELSVVDDQRGCPTYARDLASAIEPLINSGFVGMLHCTNAGNATWFELANEIVKISRKDDIVMRSISSDDLNQPAIRPEYSVLDTSICDELIGARRNWKTALREFLLEV